jgi:hypothetical protein
VSAAGQAGGKSNAFLQLPKETNVRVRAPEVSFPSVPAIVQDMALRRDASEESLTAHVLELQQKLLQAENGMAKKAMGDIVAQLIRHCSM